MLGKTIIEWAVWLFLGFLDVFFKTVGFLLALAVAAMVGGFAWGAARLGLEAKRRYETRKVVEAHFTNEAAQAK